MRSQEKVKRYAEAYIKHQDALLAGAEIGLSRRSSFRYSHLINTDLINQTISKLTAMNTPVTKKNIVIQLLEDGCASSTIQECGISERYIREIKNESK